MILSLVAIAALAIVMGFAVSTFLTRAVSDWESDSAVSAVRREVGELGADALFLSPRGATTGPWREVLSQVARTVPGVVRSKVWGRDRTVVWSDDAALIGRPARDNPDLTAALAGQVVARVTERAGEDADATGRPVLTRIYVPVVSQTGGEVRGVVELRKIPSRLFDTLPMALGIIWAIALGGGVVLWLVSRPLVRQAAAANRARRSGAPALPTRTAAEILTEIRERFGFVPPFFEPAVNTPTVLENLWQQTLSAYVTNPLPAIFKEKLFAYLSRYCAVPYCLVCHSCALRPLGMTATQVLALLDSPPPTEIEIPAQLTVLAAEPGPLAIWPEPGSAVEKALIDGSIFVFLRPEQSDRCRAELRRLLGPAYARLAEFLAYVRTCHAWVEAHPEVAYEADQRAKDHLRPMIEEEPGLADFFRDYGERVRRERQSREQRRLAELEARAAELASANAMLRAELRQARERSGQGR